LITSSLHRHQSAQGCKGAAAVTLLVAIVVIALGVSQIGLALKIRP
jgi:hypothetical protein